MQIYPSKNTMFVAMKENCQRAQITSVKILYCFQQVKPSLAKVLLHERKWKVKEIETSHWKNPENLLIDCRIAPNICAQVSVLKIYWNESKAPQSQTKRKPANTRFTCFTSGGASDEEFRVPGVHVSRRACACAGTRLWTLLLQGMLADAFPGPDLSRCHLR